jgi:hypothetical protein
VYLCLDLYCAWACGGVTRVFRGAASLHPHHNEVGLLLSGHPENLSMRLPGREEHLNRACAPTGLGHDGPEALAAEILAASAIVGHAQAPVGDDGLVHLRRFDLKVVLHDV